MNSYFCSVGKDLADKISPVANPLLSGDFEMNKAKAKFHFKAIEVQEIRDAFAKVKTPKSFGIDNISSYFLKLALPFIENSLAFMFNTSIQTSMFPDSWKIARITPIYKNGDRADKSNYRPISVLPVIHMEDNCLFSSGQSAYLRFHSTVTHLLKNTDDWYNGLDLGKLVGLVFIDLKKLLTLLTMRFSARNWCICEELENFYLIK